MKTIVCHPDDISYFDSFIHFLESDLSPNIDIPVIMSYYSQAPKSQFNYYNTEQLSCLGNLDRIKEKIKLNPNLKELWDYSKANIDILAKHSITARYVPIQTPKSYSNKLKEFRNEGIIYDVGFCGTLTSRRLTILNQLLERGIKVHAVTTFGDERDKELAKCKILLNIHAKDDYTIFESARCDAWLSIGVPVVSENSQDNDSRCINVGYDNLVSKVVEIVELEKRKMSICLVMIVKNEEEVIRRSLSSILPFVDTWCIVDTGSTDSTMEAIKEMADKFGIQGTLHQRPWVNFGHNRSEALELARSMAHWSIMFDADDIFKGFEGKKRENRTTLSPTIDVYNVTIKRVNITYYRGILFNNSRPWRYVGVVHEYSECPGLQNQKSAFLESVYIDARTEGARSKDPNKYKNDAELLEKNLQENPTDTRSMFYAAQSWRDCGNKERAYYWYSKRADTVFGYHQERYVSLFNMIKLIDSVEIKFQLAWKALSICPTRLEATYEVLKYTRSKDMWSLQAYALGYISNKEATKKPDPSFLFFEDLVHSCLFYDEFAIHCYYLGKFEECAEFAFKALQNAPPEQVERIKKNYELAIVRK